ncbi:hydrolase 2, exosortase A system-associated [Paremcibacter congregatus]|uniref:hydrolase 2, exosortase A system-associated n=1 Tax=Paremcibacter congregatus TaxID=2043170 RepID=UPI0030EF8A91
MEPLFIDSLKGQIFAVYHTAKTPGTPKGQILFIPPFAEELNRSRHMIARQARCFADQGYGVLILDLYGTGDSHGTFGDATLDIWRADILAASDWLARKSDAPCSLWAMRTGALLAADALQHTPDLARNLLLWSPVTNGKRFISQYMRIKLAAEMTGNTTTPSLTMKDLWAQLDQGKSLEIAGYDISPALAYSLNDLTLADVPLAEDTTVLWVENSLTTPAEMSPGSRKIIDQWQTENAKVVTAAVNDVSFWTLQEPEWAEEYIEQTTMLAQQNLV